MKRYIISIVVFLIAASNLYSQSGWIQKATGTYSTLNAIFMVDSLNGFVVGDNNLIFKTVNGGENWISSTVGSYNDFSSVCFVNKDTGYATGGASRLFKTTDAGNSWSYRNLGYTNIGALHFFNRNSAVCIAIFVDMYGLRYSYILKSSDGGDSWNQIHSFGVNAIQYSLFFVDSLTGFLAGGSGMYKTYNGGYSWSYTSIVSGTITEFYNFLDPYVGFETDNSCGIRKTTNGGANWNVIYTCTNNVLPGGYFNNINTGFAGGYGRIIKTSNGGSNWRTVCTINNAYAIRQICFMNSLTGFAIGDGGIILKTTNAGEPLGVSQISSEIPSDFYLSQNYPNPFNPSTKIKFDLPSVGNGRDRSVRLIIYDVLGREVATLVNEQLKPGSYEVDWDGGAYASGVYFYSLQSEDFNKTKKMLLIK